MVKILRFWNDWKLHDITQKWHQDRVIEEALSKINDPFLKQVWDFVWSIITLPNTYWIKWWVLVKSSSFWIEIITKASAKNFEKSIKPPLENHDYNWVLSRNHYISWLSITFEAKVLQECMQRWVQITREITECLKKWQIWKLRNLLTFDLDNILKLTKIDRDRQTKSQEIYSTIEWIEDMTLKVINWTNSTKSGHFLTDERFDKN